MINHHHDPAKIKSQNKIKHKYFTVYIYVESGDDETSGDNEPKEQPPPPAQEKVHFYVYTINVK